MPKANLKLISSLLAIVDTKNISSIKPKKEIYLSNSPSRISEHPVMTIPHSISGLGSTPGVSYAAYNI